MPRESQNHDRAKHQLTDQVRSDQYAALAHAVDPSTGGKTNEQEGRGLRGVEETHLHLGRAKGGHGIDRKRQCGELSPYLAQPIPYPELPKIKVVGKTPLRRGFGHTSRMLPVTCVTQSKSV